MLRVAICGGSGYTGAELLRILSGHPRVTVTAITSEQSAGKKPADIYPHLRGHGDVTFQPLRKEKLLGKADVFFMALPHAASQDAVAYFVKKGKQVVDLSADFRLKNPRVYEQWYETPHLHGDILEEAVYGLPELHRKEIKKSRLVANPGCYPTAAVLGLAPLVRAGMVDTDGIIIDAKSGTTGAGRKADVSLSFCEVNEGFRAYGVTTHRHTPEIEQELTALAGEPVAVTFTPHLLPVDRGILCTTYARAAKPVGEEELRSLFELAYSREPFVQVLEPGELPNVKYVRGGNRCHLAVAYNSRTSTIIVVTAIDNLVKGAAGQAVQCMNLMTGSRETTGLLGSALAP